MIRSMRITLTTALLQAAAWVAVAGAAMPAAAGELQFYVTSPDGQPAPDTVVMVLPVGGAPAPLPPATPVEVVQRNIRFEPYVTAVPLGATIRFVNRDRFDHHVRSAPGGPLGSIAPAQQFEFRLAAARGGNEPSVDLKMDAPGATGLGCHLHGSMRAHVYVSPSPWVAVTNAAGRVVISGVPDGAADLRLWHPDQLVAQPNVRVTLVGAGTSGNAQLNFTPRRRGAPRGDPYKY